MSEQQPPVKTPGVAPMTVVEKDVSVTLDEMAARVSRSMQAHGPLLQEYHNVWYNAPHTWHFLHFLGVGMMKCPNDLWMYQELMAAERPRVIIETGTYQGGSALWFAFLTQMLGIEGARVFTVDFEDHRRCGHERITFLGGDSRDPAIRDAIAEEVAKLEAQYGPAPRLISLDADHSADHVRRELELYAPLAQVGDYLVVEDTNISWGQEHKHALESEPGARTTRWRCSCGVLACIDLPDQPPPYRCYKDDGKGDRGARGGIEDYLANHPGEFIQDVLCERWLLSMHPGGWLRRVAACSHGGA